MDKSCVLAFDFGASSGRAIVGELENGKITLKETHRFLNEPVICNKTFYWDILRLMYDIKKGIITTVNSGYNIDSIAFDTWGVDFGLLDKDDNLLENPVHYRDIRTDGIMEKVDEVVGNEMLYDTTGIQFMKFNTINQLYSLKLQRPDLLERAKTMLFIPDLMVYYLTGVKNTEYSIASTSAMLNPNTGDWAYELLSKLGIDAKILTKISDSGHEIGMLSEDICEELSISPIKVVSAPEHDTASAVASVPSTEDDFVYISCGTWSLLGTELSSPLISEQSKSANFTNEGGFGRSVRFLKNIIGLWLMQESRRQWEREGEKLSFKDIDEHTINAKGLSCFIRPSDDMFLTPGNMPRRIREFCEKTGQYVPQTKGEIARCITESLAMEYRYTIEELEKTTGKKYKQIHIIGGGVQDKLLCQFTANVTGKTVIAGPIEATAIGNIAVQLIALGKIKDLKHARKIIKNSFETITYQPKDTKEWNSAYNKFLELT